MKIRLLEQNVANQIAAGEVVERPASVVKELVENSIDAKCSSVTIETDGGGVEYIRITDNGHGIDADDAPVAFERHATSKIRSSEDLMRIETLGFRGEALASVAAVSKVTMRTRTKDSDYGTFVSIDAGEIKENSQCGCLDGTTIEVRDLFYNVPARRKFLKSHRSENAFIADYVSRLILARPDISIKLIQDGKTIYHSLGDGKLTSAIYTVYGKETLDKLCAVSYDDGYVLIDGYVGNETILQASRQKQSLFVNGRYIKSAKLSYALQRAFDTRAMKGQFPFAVINMKLSSSEIDVNVHPNKIDVRFRDEMRVENALVSAVKRALTETSGILSANLDRIIHQNAAELPQHIKSEIKASVIVEKPVEKHGGGRAFVRDYGKEIFRNAESMPVSGFGEKSPSFALPFEMNTDLNVSHTENTINEQRPPAEGITHKPPIQEVKQTSISKKEAVKASEVLPIQEKILLQADEYRLVGNIFSGYWIIQQGNNIFLIDQHAAHERMLYEKLNNTELTARSQLLLISQHATLDPNEYATYRQNAEIFEELGFEIEDFGTMSVSVKAVPYILDKVQAMEFFSAAISALMTHGRATNTEIKRNELMQLACKKAVKVSTAITEQEARALLEYYEKDGVPLTCPHGRPVMVKISKRDIEKLFKRIV